MPVLDASKRPEARVEGKGAIKATMAVLGSYFWSSML